MKYIGLLIDPKGRDGNGGYYLSEEMYDLIAYDLIYEPEFICPQQ